MVGGAGAAAAGSRAVINHLLAGRIIAGATVEREVPTALGQGAFVHYEMSSVDFGTTQRVVEAINREMGAGMAKEIDGRLIQVKAPLDSNARVAFMGRIENLEVRPMRSAAKVVVNPRNGSVVMNQTVTIESCAVAHGALSVVVNTEQQVSQPKMCIRDRSTSFARCPFREKVRQRELLWPMPRWPMSSIRGR